MFSINNTIMDDFEMVDKNSLEIDINEQNLNSTFNTTYNDSSPEKDYDFSIISEEIKNEDVGNIANIVESDCTSPLIIENVDINTESVENINNESMNNDSFPLTMLNIPLDSLDLNPQNTDNCAEILKENLDKDDKVNFVNSSLSFNEEKENIRSNYESLENNEDKSDRIIENVQTNIIREVKEMDMVNVNEESSLSKNDTEIIKLTNKIDETDCKVNVIKENIDDSFLYNSLIDNEIDRENANIVSNENELLNKKDEPDFRVNIIERNESEDKWSTNEYIHNDNVVKPSDNIDRNNGKKEEKKKLDNETNDSNKNESVNNSDEPDFRVNIIERNDSEDKWSTNEYIHNDNVVKPSDNIDRNEKKEEKKKLDNETKDSNKNESVNNSDEPDFRVNIIERNESEDKWSVSGFTPDTDVNKEISSKIEKIENQSINSEINSFNLEEIKSDSIESSNKVDLSNNDESDSKNNEFITSSNGNEPDEIIQELDNQQNENECILSKSQENVKSENNNQSELQNNKGVTESQKIDSDNNKTNIDTKTRGVEPVIIRPLGVDDPISFPGMSALIHVLFNCVEFRRKMIEYHNTDQIAYFDLDSNPNIKSEDLLFINNLCKLFVVMKENNFIKIHEVGQLIRKYFRNFNFQLNAVSGFEYILEKINAITRTVSDENNTFIKEEDIAFFNFKLQNKNFVNDFLIGQIMNTTFCSKCHKVHKKTYDHIRYLSVKIPTEKNNVNLENCIKTCLSEVKIETPHNYNCCSEPDIKLDRKFTHIPEYLFIYLDRKLENNEIDNAFVETDNGIFLKSVNGTVLYSLCSVIDELFVNQTFFNSVKCLSDAWWNIDYTNCRKIADFEIITGNSVGFIFKKQID